MSERLKFMGKLQEKKNKAGKLKLLLDAGRESLRDLLDPFEALEKLQDDQIAAQALEFTSRIIHYRELLKEIRLIEKTLGGN